jgi:hypothetical protein
MWPFEHEEKGKKQTTEKAACAFLSYREERKTDLPTTQHTVP